MKFVATSNFRNTHPKDIEVAGDVEHPAHIHKGARLEIGKGNNFDDLKKPDLALIAALSASGRIVAASQKDDVAQIDAEVEAEKAAAKKEAEKAKKAEGGDKK